MKDPREEADENTPTSPVRLEVLAANNQASSPSVDPVRTLAESIENAVNDLRKESRATNAKIETIEASIATFLTKQVNVIADFRTEIAERDAKQLTAYAQTRREYQELRAGMLNMGVQVGRLDSNRPVSKAELEAVRVEVARTRDSLAEMRVLEERTAHLAKDIERVEDTVEDTQRREAEANIRKAAELDARASHHELEKVVLAHVLEEKREEKKDERVEKHAAHSTRSDILKLVASAIITLALALLAQRFGLAAAPAAPAAAPAHGHP